jgi:hypothetical protein
VTCDSKPLV